MGRALRIIGFGLLGILAVVVTFFIGVVLWVLITHPGP
jgi:hypothetical protein